MLSLIETKTVVKYDRSARLWLAVNGKTESFPAGDDGRRAALLCALGNDFPDLATVVSDIAESNGNTPALVERLIKAAQLLTKGHCYANGRVLSQSQEGVVYQTSYSSRPSSYYCNCEDFDRGMQRRAGLSQHGGVEVAGIGLMCKHTLAQHLAYLTGWKLEDEPIPFGSKSILDMLDYEVEL